MWKSRNISPSAFELEVSWAKTRMCVGFGIVAMRVSPGSRRGEVLVVMVVARFSKRLDRVWEDRAERRVNV